MGSTGGASGKCRWRAPPSPRWRALLARTQRQCSQRCLPTSRGQQPRVSGQLAIPPICARARERPRVLSGSFGLRAHHGARGPTLGAQAIRMGVTARTVAQWLAFRRCALPNGINRRKSSLDSKTYSSIICTMGAPFEHDAAYAPTSTSPKSKSDHPHRHEQLLSFRDN